MVKLHERVLCSIYMSKVFSDNQGFLLMVCVHTKHIGRWKPVKLCGFLHFLPQPSNIFTQIYLPYLWHFATLSVLNKIFHHIDFHSFIHKCPTASFNTCIFWRAGVTNCGQCYCLTRTSCIICMMIMMICLLPYSCVRQYDHLLNSIALSLIIEQWNKFWSSDLNTV